MAGRPRKPIELHLVQGTAEISRFRRQKRELEPQISEKLGGAPEWLPAEAAAEWEAKRISTPWLKSTDASAFMAYCGLFARIKAKLISDDDITAGEWAAFRSYCQSFGFDPASRCKIQMPEQAKPKNAFAALG